MTTPTPNWDHLPGDPLAFFELSPEFTRKDLKRAYTKLIRVFKPETFPAEFQRIRGAYDLLDERLRYMGGSPLAPAMPSFPIEVEETVELSSEVDHAALLEEKGVAGARIALRGLPELRAKDWCQLALLEEVVEEDPLALARALIEGIQKTDGAHGVVQFLRAYIHGGVAARDSAVLVQELVALVSGPRAVLPAGAYWFLTEPLWIELVRNLEFSTFAELLETCTRKVGEEGWPGRLVALTTLIRRAMLRADQDWIDSVWQELIDSYNKLSPWNQADIDLIEWLLSYRYQRDEFRRPNELRESMDRALTAIIEGDEVKADRAFLEAQVACLDQSDELLEVFPFTERAGMPVSILLWYADEVAARHGDYRERENEEEEANQVREFSHRLLRRTRRHLTFRSKQTLVGCGALMALFMFWGGTVLFLSMIPWMKENQWVINVAVLAVLVFGFFRGWIGRGLRNAEAPFLRRLHRMLWREMTMEFLAESHIPLREVLSTIENLEKKDTDLDDYINYVAEDEALFLYSSALRFA